VFDLQECPITDPLIVAAWTAIRAASRLLPRTAELRGTVRRSGDDLAFIVEGGDTWHGAREFARAVPELHVIRWRPSRGASRIVVDRRAGGAPDESFDQVNQPVAMAARQELVDRALAAAPRTAIDAYAGLGATARQLAAQGISVTAIESDEAAAAYASRHLPPESRVIAGHVEEEITAALPADVVIVNPPRAGIDGRVASALDAAPTRLLYMSCDAATLARDVSRLPAYRVESLRAYDMFPQTAHVEVVCALVPSEGA
jgi:23S rRNA (uracil1939-C5)-methyltransferase